MTRFAALFALPLSLAAWCVSWAPASDAIAPKPIVRLGVLIVFDQMRGDYIDRWKEQFADDGFKRLQTDGAWFKDCHYPYATTATGPGHASILSGCSPARHGIINNEWYDAKAGENVYCAGSARYSLVPVPPAPPVDPDAKPAPMTARKPKSAGTPELLNSETVADRLKLATKGQGKVFGLSLKDRSAILPSGRKPDGVYWFDGRFVTSTYYRDTPHPWVDTFNKEGHADKFFQKDWLRFKPDLDYAKLAGPDDAAGEGKGIGQGIAFPHPTDGGKKKLGKEYYDALATSPFGNELLLALAKECVIAEKLGQRDSTDLLTISFSSNDLIGHSWGPDSQEVLDATLRSDAIIADLLRFLDEKVGKGQYAIVLTADHGICPLPEVSAKKGLDAARISPIRLLLGAEQHLTEQLGGPPQKLEAVPTPPPAVKPEPTDGKNKEEEPATPKKNPNRWIEALNAPNVYLNRRLIESKGLKIDTVADTLAQHLRQQNGIHRVYTRKQMQDDNPTDDPITQRVRRSYSAARSGDLYIVLKPLYLVDSRGSGTTHGTPHAYDTHVPLLVYGPGVVGGVHAEKVTPLHAAPIMADFIGTKPPADCDCETPKTLRKK